MFSTDFIFRQQENLVDNQKCQAGFRPLCNKILKLSFKFFKQNQWKTLILSEVIQLTRLNVLLSKLTLIRKEKQFLLLVLHFHNLNTKAKYLSLDKETMPIYFQVKITVILMPCPFTGPKMLCAGPHFLFRTKNVFTYCASHKHFVPDKKMICNQ